MLIHKRIDIIENNVTEILQAVALLVSTGAIALLTYFVRKYGANRINKILEVVRIAVNAIEQLGRVNGWDGKQKKAEALSLNYITKTLNAKGIKVKKADLDMMIESVVAEFNKNRPV